LSACDSFGPRDNSLYHLMCPFVETQLYNWMWAEHWYIWSSTQH
jgi:hypothetical protein